MKYHWYDDMYLGKNHLLKVVLAINMYAFMKYDVGLSLWRLFSVRHSGDHVWRWNATESPRCVHSSGPMTRHWQWAYREDLHDVEQTGILYCVVVYHAYNKTEDRGQSILKSIGTLRVLRCIFGPNLEILTSISGDLPRGQTHTLKMG